MFFQSIKPNSKQENGQPGPEFDELLSEANISKDPCGSPDKFYQEKRIENERKLRFLIKKEKALKNFFQQLQI